MELPIAGEVGSHATPGSIAADVGKHATHDQQATQSYANGQRCRETWKLAEKLRAPVAERKADENVGRLQAESCGKQQSSGGKSARILPPKTNTYGASKIR